MDNNKRFVQIGVIVGVVFIVLVAFGSSIFVRIQPGERGVLFHTISGEIEQTPYEQGLVLKAPWNNMYVYNVKRHERKETMTVLSSNGLDIKLDVSVRFYPKPSKLPVLHENLGTGYVNKIVIPEVRSSTREVIGEYTPEELYSTKRGEIQSAIEEKTRVAFKENHLVLDAVPIRSIILPEKIKQAIERKLTAEQKIQEKEYEKRQAQKEAERREIEAKGKAKANEILSKSLTDKVLRDKGIDATERLAESENSKVVVIGGGGDGLPLILNSDK